MRDHVSGSSTGIPTEHRILSSLTPVLSSPAHVRIVEGRIEDVAGWMAFEELPWPDFKIPVLVEASPEDEIDFIFLAGSTNFAFTDFESYEVFRTTFEGVEWSDAEAMMACLKRAYQQGMPVLEGDFLATVSRQQVDGIFAGSGTIPMLDERVRIFNEVGRVLAGRYEGRFHRFIAKCPSVLYAGGNGLLERLVSEFASFNDTASYRGSEILFYKRVQLLLWMLHSRFRSSGIFELRDAEALTAFADYILPLAYQKLGIVLYSEALQNSIEQGRLIPAGSAEEVEIRASTIWASHLLCRAINRRRPPDRQIIAAVLDGRLWTHYHSTFAPHHLTRTTAY